MKKFIFILTAVVAVFSCGRVMELEMPDQVGHDGKDGHDGNLIHFRAGLTNTRAQFGEKEYGAYPTLWTSNDQELKLSMNLGTAESVAITPSEDFRSATFSVDVDLSGSSAPYTFYAVSPASAAQSMSPSRAAWKVSIPCEQTPTAGSADEAGIILAAASVPYEAVAADDIIDLYFDHLTAYGRMSLPNLSLHEDEAVTAVELTISTPIAGDWYWHTSGTSITDYGASSTLTIHTSSVSDIWFACAPVDVSGEVMYVTVYTNQGFFEQLVEFPENRRFEAGRCAVFSVDMNGSDYTANEAGGTPSGDFTLVTDASTLQAGDEVLIVYTAGAKAMGASSSNGNYREDEDVTISGGVISSPGSATVFTLCQGKTAGTWAFLDGSNYLTSPSGSSNYLQNSNSISDNSSWSVTIDSGGNATVIATSGGRTYLRYNTGSPRFACYKDATVANTATPSIYRRSGGGSTSAEDPLLAHSDYGCYLGGSLTRTLVPGTDQVTRAYDASGIQTYTIIDPETVEELEITGYKKSCVKGDAVNVTVNWRQGLTMVHSANYKMKLIKEEGPKVWLSDGNGKGLIIKK